MSGRRKYPIPPETRKSQSDAADPSNSAWVSANAGSGKTHVLSRRVMRLLLAGADPSRILCLTYTKAAAANMSNRVFQELARWTMLADAELAGELHELEGRNPDSHRLAAARRLFAEALETPGGLKIQTIHAFCEAVLHQFPLEANIAGHFELLDTQAERALVAEARREMLTGVAAANSTAVAAAFAEVLSRGGEQGLDDLLAEIVSKRDELRAFLVEMGGQGFAPLFEEFGFEPNEDASSIALRVWPVAGFDQVFVAELFDAAQTCGATKALEQFLPRLMPALAEADPVLRLRLLGQAFLKQDGTPFSATWLFVKALRAAVPTLEERFETAAALIVTTLDRLHLHEMLGATAAALTLADDLIRRYERLKSARGFLDFNDLITRTASLLSRLDAGAWILYRLDRGIDHILIDEAQDTSPGQWSVIRALTTEFFAGVGARDHVERTVFAVGDEKQSIYSFQGAEPDAFAETRAEFSGRIAGVGRRFRQLRLSRSFRSVGDVLSAVDLVFGDPASRQGLTRDDEPIRHEPIREGAPGYVELWPSIGRVKMDEPEDWADPIDHVSTPAVVLAERIAATIRRWIDEGDVLEETGKPVSAGNILVLVRKRDRFVHALSRALKNLRHPRIAVAGADRLDLSGHIAVRDLMAIGRFALQSDDDLSLAALLRSPLFDLDEDTLFRLASDRPAGLSLWRRLHDAATREPSLQEAVTQLVDWSARANREPVFEFYAGILGRDRARLKFLRRLGHEVGEIVDEFLSFCLTEERIGLPGLEAFLATLDEVSPEIKREMDQGRDEVRIMTVHASKGLEAPVVFLVDSGGAPSNSSHLPRLAPFTPRSRLWEGKGWIWRATSELANQCSRDIERALSLKAEDEYRRLLYVGMTRAEDRLILCGYHGTKRRDDTWHAMVDRALAGSSYSHEVAHPAAADETVLRYRVSSAMPPLPGDRDAVAPRDVTERPAWMSAAPPPPDPLPRPLSPSGISVLIDEERQMEADPRSLVLADREPVAPAVAINRGLLMHRLLQMLPGLPGDSREAAALRYLDKAAVDWPSSQRAQMWDAVRTILDDAMFAPVFAPGSRAEVSVTGIRRIAGSRRAISGRMDRLVVEPDRVLIVDYKSGRPPRTPSEIPLSYLVQMALYRDLIAPLYGDRRIEAALLFTEAPVLLALDAARLDAALALAGLA